MSVSLSALPQVSVLYDAPFEEVLQTWTNTSDEDLALIDSTYGSSLLFFAVQRPLATEATQLAKYLVEERRVCDAAHTDVNLQTALFFAARDGHAETCEFLLAAGCDVANRDTAGQTALFYASREGRCDAIRVLENYAIAHSTTIVNVLDKMGQSALFYAAREGQQEACELLLEFGADPSIRDWQKKSCHTYATRRGHAALGAFLKARSAEARKSVQTHDDDRQKLLLQYHLEVLPNQHEWIFPTAAIIEEFEKQFPNLAAWSHMNAAVYEADDAFRMEWCQLCLDIVNVISNYKDAVWFAKPVDVRALNCPDYYDIVKEPRDLSLIKKKLKALEYRSLEDFRKDITLVWENCFRYNPAASPVYKAGEHVRELFEKAWTEKNLEAFKVREANLHRALAERVLLPPKPELPGSMGEETAELAS